MIDYDDDTQDRQKGAKTLGVTNKKSRFRQNEIDKIESISRSLCCFNSAQRQYPPTPLPENPRKEKKRKEKKQAVSKVVAPIPLSRRRKKKMLPGEDAQKA